MHNKSSKMIWLAALLVLWLPISSSFAAHGVMAPASDMPCHQNLGPAHSPNPAHCPDDGFGNGCDCCDLITPSALTIDRGPVESDLPLAQILISDWSRPVVAGQFNPPYRPPRQHAI